MNLYRALALATLAVHLLWLVWVLLGWTVTRGRPLLRWLHIGSLLYGILISVAPWFCPLTHAEQYFQQRAGLEPYEASFLEHYFEALIYPDVNQTLLMWTAVAVCCSILGVYFTRFARRKERSEW